MLMKCDDDDEGIAAGGVRVVDAADFVRPTTVSGTAIEPELDLVVAGRLVPSAGGGRWRKLDLGRSAAEAATFGLEATALDIVVGRLSDC